MTEEKHAGYLSYLEDEKNIDLEGLVAALTKVPMKYSNGKDVDLYIEESQHLLKLQTRINTLMTKYPYRFFYFGKSYKKREALRTQLLSAKVHCDLAADILLILFKSNTGKDHVSNQKV